MVSLLAGRESVFMKYLVVLNFAAGIKYSEERETRKRPLTYLTRQTGINIHAVYGESKIHISLIIEYNDRASILLFIFKRKLGTLCKVSFDDGILGLRKSRTQSLIKLRELNYFFNVKNYTS